MENNKLCNEVGKPMNCPKCKHWCIAPYYMGGKIVGYECKECNYVFGRKNNE